MLFDDIGKAASNAVHTAVDWVSGNSDKHETQAKPSDNKDKPADNKDKTTSGNNDNTSGNKDKPADNVTAQSTDKNQSNDKSLSWNNIAQECYTTLTDWSSFGGTKSDSDIQKVFGNFSITNGDTQSKTWDLFKDDFALLDAGKIGETKTPDGSTITKDAQGNVTHTDKNGDVYSVHRGNIDIKDTKQGVDIAIDKNPDGTVSYRGDKGTFVMHKNSDGTYSDNQGHELHFDKNKKALEFDDRTGDKPEHIEITREGTTIRHGDMPPVTILNPGQHPNGHPQAGTQVASRDGVQSTDDKGVTAHQDKSDPRRTILSGKGPEGDPIDIFIVRGNDGKILPHIVVQEHNKDGSVVTQNLHRNKNGEWLDDSGKKVDVSVNGHTLRANADGTSVSAGDTQVNSNGTVNQSVDGKSTTLDAQGNSTTKASDGGIQQTTVDDQGHVRVTERDPSGRTTETEQGPDGKVTHTHGKSQAGPDGRVTDYTPDNGQQTWGTDEHGNPFFKIDRGDGSRPFELHGHYDAQGNFEADSFTGGVLGLDRISSSGEIWRGNGDHIDSHGNIDFSDGTKISSLNQISYSAHAAGGYDSGSVHAHVSAIQGQAAALAAAIAGKPGSATGGDIAQLKALFDQLSVDQGLALQAGDAATFVSIDMTKATISAGVSAGEVQLAQQAQLTAAFGDANPDLLHAVHDSTPNTVDHAAIMRLAQAMGRAVPDDVKSD